MIRKSAKCFSFRQEWKELHPLTTEHTGEWFPVQSQTLSPYNRAIKPAPGSDS